MPVGCCVKDCRRNTRKDRGHSFFILPTDSKTREEWLKFAQTDARSKNLRICSDHFEPKQIWKRYPRPLLVPKSIPTLQKPASHDSPKYEETTMEFQRSAIQDDCNHRANEITVDVQKATPDRPALVTIQCNSDIKVIVKGKKCITKVNELMERSEAVAELHENSRNKKGSGTNWTSIMHSVHNVLLHIADKSMQADDKKSASTSKLSKDAEARSDLSITMLNTVKKANSSEIFLSCNDLISIVLQILSDERYVDFQKTYMTILVHHILNIKQYQTEMLSDHWEEFLKTSISFYEDGHPYIEKRTILEAIHAIVKYGSKQSHLALQLKKFLPSLVKFFSDAKSGPRGLSPLTFKIVNAVCQAIGPESRVALCEFGESVLRCAIDLNGNSAKYDWILLIVRAHHPGGVTKEHDASYACDWEKWNDLLRLIYCMVINDCKSGLASDNYIADSLVQLACEVSWQLKDDHTCIDENISLDESCYEQPAKRSRTVIGIQGMIDVLTVNPLKEFKPSIQILSAIITRYPKSVKESNFLPLMEFLTDYLNTCKEQDVIDQLWELGEVMIQFESKLSNSVVENHGTMWDKIWTIALRSASTNKHAYGVHKFLQSLLSNKKVIDSGAFLNLYLKDTIVWSKASIHTLLTFCKHNIIQNCSQTSLKDHALVVECLLKWVLAIPQDQWNAQFPIEEVCELLIGLTLKSWYNVDRNIPRQPEIVNFSGHVNSDWELTSNETNYLLTAFETSLCSEASTRSIQHCRTVKDNVLYVKKNLDLLISDLAEKITLAESTHLLIVQTAVIAKILSNFKLLNIALGPVEKTLSTVIKNSMEDISLSIETLVKSKKKLKGNNLINVLEALYLFYKTPYDTDVADIIRSSTDTNLLRNLLRLTDVEKLCKTDDKLEMGDRNTTVNYIKKDDLSERHRLYKSKEHSQEPDHVSDLDNIRMKASSILATFCSMVNGGTMSGMQEKLQTALLNPDNYELTQMLDSRMALMVLKLLADCEVSSFSSDIVDGALKLLQQLCRYWHKDADAARNILIILSKLFLHLGSIGTVIQQQNSLRILRKFHELLQEHKYGPNVYVTFIQCLETIARIDPSFTWTNWEDNSDATPVVEDLLVYIGSPFHIVRFQAIKCLRVLFSSEVVALDWLKKFFSKLSALISDSLFVLKGEYNDKIKEDERRNRTASALHIMAVIISCSAIFRSEAMLSMFQLTVDKNVNSNIVKKVLQRITNTLQICDSSYSVENNLNYLLTHWLEKKYSLDKFPAILVNCASDQEFYVKYIAVIVPIQIRSGNLKSAFDLCKQLDISFKDVIENCFPCLISWILPCVSADPHAPSTLINVIDIKRATTVFTNLKRCQNEFINVSKMSVLLEKNLENVLLTMLKCLHDEEHSMEFLTIKVNYPPSDLPHFKHADIVRGFKYLEDNIIRTGQSLLNILATTKLDVLQKVLLHLKCSIHKVTSVEYRLKALHQYVYFSMMILKEIGNNYFDEMSAYIIREICHTLTYFVKASSNSVSQAACSYFKVLLQHILLSRQAEIEQHLRLIVSSLIPIVKSEQTPHAYDILEFLITKQNNVLEEAIRRLDSFPMDRVFYQMREIQSHLKDKDDSRQSLELEFEVQHFLNTRGENAEYCSSTELAHLEKQLSTKKTELREIYQKLGSTQRFSEDCASSVLHQLICALVKLTSANPDISLRAAKCLGELGPADLSTMILQPERNHFKHQVNPMSLFTYRVLVLLSNLLVHPDVRLSTATSEALYTIMASCWGQRLTVQKNRNELKSLIEGSEEFLRFEYIRPFITKPSQSNDNTTIDNAKFNECVNKDKKLWIGKINSLHGDWVTNIACQILNCFDGSYLSYLIPVCRSNISFCEKILPWIIHLVLHTEKKLNTGIYNNINFFFNHHFNKINEFKDSLSPSSSQKTTCLNHESVQCMLNVVEFIRSQSADNCQFDLNYLHIAKAAQYCSAYFTSVLYAELWCERFLRDCPTIDDLTPIEYISEIEPEDGKVLQEILREAFIKIGDPDAIYGCGASYFLNPSAKIEHYVQLRKWDKVLLAHDIELSLGNKTVTKGLLDALQHSGLQYLLGAFVKTIDRREEDVDSNCQYECAWRLSDWNLSATQEMLNLQQDNNAGFQNIASNDYPLFHYHALKSFHESDTDGLKSSLDSARTSIIKTLHSISLESCKTIYPALSQLQMLREIEEIYFATPETYSSIIEKWNIQDSMGFNDFEYIEPILSQRSILLQARVVDGSQVIENALVDTYLQVTEASKKHGSFQMAARALGSLAKQVKLSPKVTNILQYEEANLAWMRGDQELGRHLLRNLIAGDSLDCNMRSQALRVYGNWMAETKSENPQRVIQKYYLTSLESSNKIQNPTKDDAKNLLDTQAALAQFADVQYQQILTYMRSPQFESFKDCVAYSEEAIGKLSAVSKDDDERRAANLNKKQSSNDMAELENIEREKNMYLLLALKHYILTLQRGDDHNLLIFRLVALWLDNPHHEELNQLLKNHLDKLPSYKFILLVPQLAPHMTDTDDIFSTQIYHLLKRCAVEHPHHTLPVLLSLKNLHKDHDFYKSKKKPVSEPRVLGAKKLIAHLLTTNIKPIIEEMDRLAHSLIMLANVVCPKVQSKTIVSLPDNPQSIVHIKNLQHCSVPTLSIDIKPSKVYDHVISIQRYINTFELVGGINAPKKVTCIGTDGKKRNQLVKGRDDLRQDAVMQQVFTVMNMLLKTSKETKRRKLSVRTYKVVPLTQRCGILEWCDKTMPISMILEGGAENVGLHKKYYPNDYTTRECRERMGKVAKKPNAEKLKEFLNCCKHLHPVFHYFFIESFTSPEIWFERRLTYVHSVATTSIIGYILGLGDRHMNNILVDKSTAEVIHIDFGIAFEQGKVLPTPETVPFRLTRDIEAAMGVSGVEGVFRRSCEETMTVLRHHRAVIITLLQVLLYDPLFSWAITPAKAYSFQKGQLHGSSERREAFGETNKFAERALLRLDQKLRGTEEGSASSVAGQVEKLLQEARDPANLSRLFVGWQAYL